MNHGKPTRVVEPIRPEHRTSAEDMRTPPHSVQAEQSLLGGLMLDNQTWDEVHGKVAEEDFYLREHRLIFAAVRKLAEDDQPFDVVTMAETLENNGQIEDAGGLAYLGVIVQDTPSAANIRAYAKIVRKHSVSRRIISAGIDISEMGFSPGARDVSDLLDEAENKIRRISEREPRGGGGFRHVSSLLAEAVSRIEDLFERDEPVTGLPSGFTDFDMMTSGLQASDLIVVAGRPSMGKSAFAMNIAENVALATKLPVAVFSMEMRGDALAMRMISSLGRIDQHRVREGRLVGEEWPRLASTVGILSEAPIFIDETPALSPPEMRARAHRLKRDQGGLGLIIVDYLQLMQIRGSNEHRATEVSAISRALKALAKELDIPVIALSQLNRGLEQRPNKRPIMSDLRESGAIEQDADLIAFIYRDEVYNEGSEDKGMAEIIIAKHRNGPTGTVKLAFVGRYTKFEDRVSGARAS